MGDQTRTILLVDDDHGTRVFVRRTLENAGHLVLTATQGKQALDLLKACRPDLIITDLLMPIMDGVEFALAVSQNPIFKTIPIIIMSSRPELMKTNNGLTVIEKPVDATGLLALIAGLEKA